MNIFDRIRIKRKIKNVCNIIKTLSPEEQEEQYRMIVYCLRKTDDLKAKERLFDRILEGCEGLCQ